MRAAPDAIQLAGCRTAPLASYLKALGILRVVAEQIDPEVRGRWSGGCFVLESARTDQTRLAKFLVHDFQPTPIVVPWSGSHFFGIDRRASVKTKKVPTKQQVIAAFLATSSPRLQCYRDVIELVFEAMATAGVGQKKDIEGGSASAKLLKRQFILALRNIAPDKLVPWIDAAATIRDEAVSLNRLLGSGGGSDGNSHFSDNYMQALWMVLPEFAEQRQSALKAADGFRFDPLAAASASLSGDSLPGTLIAKLSPALYDSPRRGGANQVSGFASEAISNPWDFVLMLEGALFFAGNLARKRGSLTAATAAFPFLLRASAAGAGSMTDGESAQAELWCPIWEVSAGCDELRQLFSEGRIGEDNHPATRGVDAVEAVTRFGVQRGIVAFRRVGLLKGRIGGQNYLASVGAGMIRVQRVPEADLLNDIAVWRANFARKTRGKNAPAAAGRALRQLEDAIFVFCQRSENHAGRRLLLALGHCEKTLAGCLQWARDARIAPIPPLSHGWLDEAGLRADPAGRIAMSLASVHGRASAKKRTRWLRENMETVRFDGTRWRWRDDETRSVIGLSGGLVPALIKIMTRRLTDFSKDGADTYPDRGVTCASLPDVTTFLAASTSFDRELVDLLWSCLLIDWSTPIESTSVSRHDAPIPDASYALAKLCFAGSRIRNAGRVATERPSGGPAFEAGVLIPLVPAIYRLLATGNGGRAGRMANARLRASGLTPRFPLTLPDGPAGKRLAAALLLPVHGRDVSRLRRTVIVPQPRL